MVTIRGFREDDVNRLTGITEAALRQRGRDHRDPPPVVRDTIRQFEDTLAFDAEILVAEDDDAVVGWGLIYPSEPAIATVFVDPEAESAVRGRLIDRLEGIAREVGQSRLRILTY